MRKLQFVAGVFCLLLSVSAVRATIFGTVKGIVHDPQHRPVQNAAVTLKAADSDFTQTQTSSDSGAFEFDAVPIGNYTVTVSLQGFQTQQQNVIVQSDTSPELHFALGIATVNQNAEVIGTPVVASTDTITTTSLLSRADIQAAPGADRTDSMAMITDNVPGAYMVHDMLHIRGGHQFTWLIDGVPVPNTNIADNVGPQIDPKDLDYVEVQRGSYDAEYGDRTYGIFNAVPRTGFERDKECELVLSLGSYYQTNDQINCGGHTQRFAYYGSLNGNRTDLGLETPVPQIQHDAANGYGGFGTLIFNADPKDQLRLVTSLRQDYFQIPDPPTSEISQPFPYSPETVVVTAVPGVLQDDSQKETDGLLSFSWIHTFSHQGILNASPFYHFNGSNYDSSPLDTPNAVTVHRSSSYIGAQVTVGSTIARNTWQGGIYGFWQRDNQLFGVLFTNPVAPPVQLQQIVNGNVEAVFVQDKFAVTSWLTFDGGLRQTHFASAPFVFEDATSPRAGVAVKIPRLNWVFRGFYGQFYQAPPLITISGPGPLQALVNTPMDETNPQLFVPLHGERDTEDQFGVTIPYKGWTADIDTFRTRSHNFLDHGNVNYVLNDQVFSTNIYLPLTTQDALVRGWELTLRSPRLWGRGQVHLAYSNQVAEFMGTITGGLTVPGADAQVGWAPLDHDQRDTLDVGIDTNLPWKTTFSANVAYGSGFSNGTFDASLVPLPPRYLSWHATVDLLVSHSFGERFSVSVNAVNVGNSHLLIDDSLTFGGFHYDDPREVYAEVRYHFHY
jgi:hypothetical protein